MIMSGAKPPKQETSKAITILLVDDSQDTRENIKKILAFENDFKVIDTAGTGEEGVEKAQKLKPNVIVMDINMPGIDGLQATRIIKEKVPTAAVIMMSVQSEGDYMRKAMMAGARGFLPKPVDMDELYATIRQVHGEQSKLTEMLERASTATANMPKTEDRLEGGEDRAGHILVVYSPQGGSGKTTIATNLASALTREGVRVLLVDADLQFGDVPAFLNLTHNTTLVNLMDSVNDLDTELFNNIVATHSSGLKVLLGPPRPEEADAVKQSPDATARILQKIAGNYDFIVVDMSTTLDEVALNLFDAASKILLVSTTALPSVKNTRFVLELFQKLNYAENKSVLVLNKVVEESQRRNATLSVQKIQDYMKKQAEFLIPLGDETTLLQAINRGVPMIAADGSRPPARQMQEMADTLYRVLMGVQEEAAPAKNTKSNSMLSGLFGRK
jgi:pilus assembly protein CpaE